MGGAETNYKTCTGHWYNFDNDFSLIDIVGWAIPAQSIAQLQVLTRVLCLWGAPGFLQVNEVLEQALDEILSQGNSEHSAAEELEQADEEMDDDAQQEDEVIDEDDAEAEGEGL